MSCVVDFAEGTSQQQLESVPLASRISRQDRRICMYIYIYIYIYIHYVYIYIYIIIISSSSSSGSS